MGFLDKMHGKKDLGVNAHDTGPNLTYAKYLKEDFGLQFEKGAWVYSGTFVDEFPAEMREPEQCIAFLKYLQKDLHFSNVFMVVADKMVGIGFNTKPTPTFMNSGLDAIGAAKLIAELIKISTKKVYECKDLWLFEL